MGIKMSEAYYEITKQILSVRQCNSSMNGNLFCKTSLCRPSVRVSYVREHIKDTMETPILVQPFFRLYSNVQHHESCDFNTFGAVNVIAKESSSNIMECLKSNKHLFRLHINCAPPTTFTGEDSYSVTGKNRKGRPPQKYYINKGTHTPYLRVIKQIIELRSRMETNSELQKLIELKAGEIIVKWNHFYYEIDSITSFLECFNDLPKQEDLYNNGHNIHPVCLQGTVEEVKAPTGNAKLYSLIFCRIHELPKAILGEKVIRRTYTVSYAIDNNDIIEYLRNAIGKQVVIFANCYTKIYKSEDRIYFNIQGRIFHKEQVYTAIN